MKNNNLGKRKEKLITQGLEQGRKKDPIKSRWGQGAWHSAALSLRSWRLTLYDAHEKVYFSWNWTKWERTERIVSSVALVSIMKWIIPFLNEIFQVFSTLIRYLKSQFAFIKLTNVYTTKYATKKVDLLLQIGIVDNTRIEWYYH